MIFLNRRLAFELVRCPLIPLIKCHFDPTFAVAPCVPRPKRDRFDDAIVWDAAGGELEEFARVTRKFFLFTQAQRFADALRRLNRSRMR